MRTKFKVLGRSVAFLWAIALAFPANGAEPSETVLRLLVAPESGLTLLDEFGKEGGDIAGAPAGAMEPNWSRDGRKVAFVTLESGVAQIFTLDVETEKIRKLTSTTTDERMPAWSPDGEKIVFMSDRTGNFEIFTMNADGADAVQLTASRLTEADKAGTNNKF